MSDHRLALPQNTILNQYRIDSVLGYGGFGIVYKARHTHLDQWVAIKEYLPQEISTREGTTVHPLGTKEQADYDEGMERFLAEAKQLVQFEDIPSIVTCRDFFEANGTAYLIMNFEDGLPLSEVLKAKAQMGQSLSEEQILSIIIPLLEGLEKIHDAGVLHRDIKPGNIFIRRADEKPVLIDFGASKQNFSQHSKSMAPYSPGYAAIEQVEEDGHLGPWTDLYAVGAVIWRIIAEDNPKPVENRTNALIRGKDDPLTSAKIIGEGRFGAHFLNAVDKSLNLTERDRFQSASEMINALTLSTSESTSPQKDSEKVSRESVSDRNRRKKSILSRSTKIQLGILLGLLISIPLIYFYLTRTPTYTLLVEANVLEYNVDIKGRGKTKNPIHLKSGTYEVSVSAEGYETQIRKIYVNDNTREKFELKRTYLLEITTNVDVADIQILGLGAYVAPRSLTEGEYTLVLSAPGYQTLEETLYLRQNNKVHYNLKPISSTLAKLLDLAQERLSQDKLTEPKNDSALDYYNQVLDIDPNNLEAQNGKRDIVERYLDIIIERLPVEGPSQKINDLFTKAQNVLDETAFNEVYQGKAKEISDARLIWDKKLAQPRKALLAAMPTSDMIRYVSPLERAQIYVFVDVECFYCRKLHNDLQQYLDAGITVNYLAFPRTGNGSGAYQKLSDVWCSNNRKTALRAAFKGEVVSAMRCSHPVATQYELGKKLGVDATPAIFTEGGMLIMGYRSSVDIVSELKKFGEYRNSPKKSPAKSVEPSVPSSNILPIVRVEPRYPSAAVRDGLEGWCRIKFTVDIQGATKDLRQDSCSDPVFFKSSLMAASKAKYKPAIQNGKAVEVPNVMLTFTFKLQP